MTLIFLSSDDAERQRVKGTPAYEALRAATMAAFRDFEPDKIRALAAAYGDRPLFASLTHPALTGGDSALVRAALNVALACNFIPVWMVDAARVRENEYRIAEGRPLVPHWSNAFTYPGYTPTESE